MLQACSILLVSIWNRFPIDEFLPELSRGEMSLHLDILLYSGAMHSMDRG